VPKYKVSNYNVIFKDGEKVIFVNFLTKAIARVDKEKYNIIEKILNSPNENWEGEYAKLRNDLVYGGYLIEENFDEIQHLKMTNYKTRFDSSVVSLTIMPTMKCNFDCIYCYESHEGASMDKETASNIANYISKIAKNKQGISIAWFGGEPLLKFDIMKYINEKAIKMCEEYKNNFSSSISTNGYLLTLDKAVLFDQLKIRNVQITLDGPAEYHNKYRPLRGGKPTFQTIFNNIEGFLKFTKEASVNLRVNVGPDNYNKIPKLLDMFETLPKDRIKVYFRWIFQGSEVQKEIHREVMNFRDKDSYEKLAKLYYCAGEKGFKIFLPIVSESVYCNYDTISSILIGPKGEIYPCTVDVREGSEFGRITEEDFEYDKTKFLQWHKHDAFQDEECKKCKLLPICMGGCRNSIVNNGIRGCPEEAGALESFAKLWYFVKVAERKLGVIVNESFKV
jgi:uncharacterized protein